ncbi:MAG: hypothetical protein OXG35_22660, partial [Acidobacteria bacterium]|nr:hypothetical protein [Acidobacteriota bacterium]
MSDNVSPVGESKLVQDGGAFVAHRVTDGDQRRGVVFVDGLVPGPLSEQDDPECCGDEDPGCDGVVRQVPQCAYG